MALFSISRYFQQISVTVVSIMWSFCQWIARIMCCHCGANEWVLFELLHVS